MSGGRGICIEGSFEVQSVGLEGSFGERRVNLDDFLDVVIEVSVKRPLFGVRFAKTKVFISTDSVVIF